MAEWQTRRMEYLNAQSRFVILNTRCKCGTSPGEEAGAWGGVPQRRELSLGGCPLGGETLRWAPHVLPTFLRAADNVRHWQWRITMAGTSSAEAEAQGWRRPRSTGLLLPSTPTPPKTCISTIRSQEMNQALRCVPKQTAERNYT